MKTAIFSDVHANWEAFCAFLVDVARRDVEALWLLGDLVGYGAEPERVVAAAAVLAGENRTVPGRDTNPETLDALRILAGKLKFVVRGNHDEAVLGSPILRRMNDAARNAILWTAGKLSIASRRYLATFPLISSFESVTLVHASPAAPDSFPYIRSIPDAARALEAAPTRMTFYGHTHQPVALTVRDGRLVSLPVREPALEGRYLINVGSIGQPRDGDPRAAYVIYDDESGRLQLVRVEYDIETAAAKIKRAGLPLILARRLYRGE